MSKNYDLLQNNFGTNFRVESDFHKVDEFSTNHGSSDENILSPNRKKSKNRFYLHDDRKGNSSNGKSPNNNQPQGIKDNSVISLPHSSESDWKHDKYDEVMMNISHKEQFSPQKSSSPNVPKDNSPKTNLVKLLLGEKHSNSSSPNSAAVSNKVSGDQALFTPDSSNVTQKNSRKKKNHSNSQVVDQTTAEDSQPETNFSSSPVNDKKQDKGRNKQKSKNKQEGGDRINDSQEISAPVKLEVIPPLAAPTPPIGFTPAPVPVPFGNVSSGTVDVAVDTGKSNSRRSKKGKNNKQTGVQLEPEGKSSPTSSKPQSRVVILQNDLNLNAPPPPPPSPTVSPSAPFDCDDFLITELTENATSSLNLGDAPKKRKRNKKKKNSEKHIESENGQSDDELVSQPDPNRSDSHRVIISVPEDIVEEVEPNQQSSKSSKKKKKNKKKSDESSNPDSVPMTVPVQTELEKQQTQKSRQHEKDQIKQPLVVSQEDKSDKGKKQKNQKSLLVEAPIESKVSTGSKTNNGQKNQPSLPDDSQSAVRACTANKSDLVDEPPPVEREGKKKRRSRRKKKHQESNDVDNCVDEHDGLQDDDDAPIEADEECVQNSNPVAYEHTPDPSTILSYTMFEATRKPSNLDDVDVPPGFEPSMEDQISSFLPSSLSASAKSVPPPPVTAAFASDLAALDIANKSIDDLVAESLSSLSRLNLDHAIDDLDTSIDIERELRRSFPIDPLFSRGNSSSHRSHSPPIAFPSSELKPSMLGGSVSRFPLETQSRLKPTARPFEPKQFPRVEGRFDHPGAYHRDPRDPVDIIPSKYGPKGRVDPGMPLPSSRPNPGQLRFAYDEPEQFGGMSPEDVIISRLPGRRAELNAPSRRPPPPSISRPRPPLPASFALDGHYEMDEYLPSYPPSSSTAYLNPKPFAPPPPRAPPPRMDIGARGGVYPSNAPIYPGVEKYLPSGHLSSVPPRDRDSGSVPGINFTLASQQPRTHHPHLPPPPPPHQHW